MEVGKVIKRGEDLLFLFFVFVFCFVLFVVLFCFVVLFFYFYFIYLFLFYLFIFIFLLFTYEKEICFGSTKMGIFSRGKNIHAGEKNQEKWLCPLRKICLLCPWSNSNDNKSLEQFQAKWSWVKTPNIANIKLWNYKYNQDKFGIKWKDSMGSMIWVHQEPLMILMKINLSTERRNFLKSFCYHL